MKNLLAYVNMIYEINRGSSCYEESVLADGREANL